MLALGARIIARIQVSLIRVAAVVCTSVAVTVFPVFAPGIGRGLRADGARPVVGQDRDGERQRLEIIE
mgnify:CR=1 FL=1